MLRPESQNPGPFEYESYGSSAPLPGLHLSINPFIHHATPLASRFEFHHVMGSRFALTCRCDANKTSFIAQLCQVCGAKITHARLNSPDELGQNAVDRSGYLLQCFNSFGRDFA